MRTLESLHEPEEIFKKVLNSILSSMVSKKLNRKKNFISVRNVNICNAIKFVLECLRHIINLIEIACIFILQSRFYQLWGPAGPEVGNLRVKYAKSLVAYEST